MCIQSAKIAKCGRGQTHHRTLIGSLIYASINYRGDVIDRNQQGVTGQGAFIVRNDTVTVYAPLSAYV